MMNKKILLPFALSTLAVFLHGCGGESSKINEDPNKGVSGVTTSTSCNPTASNCVEFILDYPIAGLNFDCSSDTVNHFATKEDGGAASGACKVSDTVSFYFQGKESRKISLGAVKLDDIIKVKDPENRLAPPVIRVIDMARALTGQALPQSIEPSNDTIRVALAIIKIFNGISLEQDDNVKGDIQPIELTAEKKDLLSVLNQDIGVTELKDGSYVNILKPWVDVSSISDNDALLMLNQLLNLSNAGVWQIERPVFKTSSNLTTALPDGFFGCNQEDYAKCMDPKLGTSLIHSMGRAFLLTDRQGYAIGSGSQWKGPATIVKDANGTDIVSAPYMSLSTKVKPSRLQVNAQNAWFNSITQEVNSTSPLQMSVSDNVADNLKITGGKLFNGHTIPGIDSIYRKLLNLKATDPVNTNNLGRWTQTIDARNYSGRVEFYKVNPILSLSKDIFKVESNVKAGEKYYFPLYATLTFRFSEPNLTPIDLGIVIDEHGDIRTDIKAGSTDTDMSGVCGTVQSLNDDGTILDSNNQVQYRVGTATATSFTATDKSFPVRMMFANSKFGFINGTYLGLNLSDASGAKINVNNLISGQSSNINLTSFSGGAATWDNGYARDMFTYVKLYDALESKNNYVPPSIEDREFAKRYFGTVTLRIADQTLPACKAIKIKS
ncbi:hypothetical protein GCM10025882_15000 [Acinetobacter gyllenbergii]|uniref:FilF n=2 Tax=Acinetobacter gyllenbergii TaxID=134534 RepID=A0A829HBV7_9GAMM|nr:hypothetical protein [Acinetobacter gyllenbergii]EPF71133.1 hypothetical protein F957_03861 [Acinetobacter gyllenbergii CIP 110306 = MTCC 11365]EPH33212.1 FilF [Acinetobacter gyllenbergii CIP 110306 = MTCC 11365]GMA11075.1 hypothetical protein GCM10025882_15000 [Acinetobacter gyllenbergii]